MKAVRVGAPGSVELVALPEPVAGAGERLVRVGAAAVCSTDRKLVARGAVPAVVPGHEVAGWLEDGTPVGVHPDTGCGRCEFCRSGLENRCPDRVPVGLRRDGGLAEWVAVPARHVVPLEGVAVDLAPLLEPLGCCVHAVRLLDVGADERAVVVGAGTMGILAAWVLQAAGAAVCVVQRSEARRQLAARLGLGAVIGPDDDPAERLGGPPTAAVVTAPGAEPLDWALQRLAAGGRAHAFAGTPGGASIDANVLHYRHLALIGSTGSAVGDYVRARELVSGGAVPLDRLPRTTIPLDAVPAALTGQLEGDGPRPLKLMVRVGG